MQSPLLSVFLIVIPPPTPATGLPGWAVAIIAAVLLLLFTAVAVTVVSVITVTMLLRKNGSKGALHAAIYLLYMHTSMFLLFVILTVSVVHSGILP